MVIQTKSRYMLYLFDAQDKLDWVPFGEITNFETYMEREVIHPRTFNPSVKQFVPGNTKVHLDLLTSTSDTQDQICSLHDFFYGNTKHLFKIIHGTQNPINIKFKGTITNFSTSIYGPYSTVFSLEIIVLGKTEIHSPIQDINSMSIFEIMDHVNTRLNKHKQQKLLTNKEM